MAALTKKATDRATTVSMVLNRMALRIDWLVRRNLRALHQGRMQVEIVRHHGRADDADGHARPCPSDRRSPG